MGKKKGHFYGTGECKCHTARDSPRCKNFRKTCNYQGVAGKLKYNQKTGRHFKYQAAHHIIPVSVLIAYKGINQYKGFVGEISDVYYATLYCANQEENVMWLPKKNAYQDKLDSWSLDLPCHDWDHNQYIDEATDLMKDAIWNRYDKKRADADCPDPEEVRVQFTNVAEFLRGELETRAKRAYMGTKGAIEVARGIRKKDPKEPELWLNFSMAIAEKASNRLLIFKGGAVPAAMRRKWG